MNTRDWWESRQPAFELYSGLGNRALALSELSNVAATASGGSATEPVRRQKVGRNELRLLIAEPNKRRCYTSCRECPD